MACDRPRKVSSWNTLADGPSAGAWLQQPTNNNSALPPRDADLMWHSGTIKEHEAACSGRDIDMAAASMDAEATTISILPVVRRQVQQ